MDVLVTGGAGFIGSNLANHLSSVGHQVTAIDDEYLGTPTHLDAGIDYRQQDVLEPDLPLEDVDVVYHLAALSSREMHEQNPRRGARVNVEGFVNVVEKAREAGCSTVVYASTSSIYNSLPGGVKDDVRAETAYEASKLARERYAEYYRDMHGMDVAGLRLFSVYGGMNNGERHKGRYANIISQFTDQIAHAESPVIWGDGSQTRDFTHVNDVVRAFSAATGESGIYNVGTGHPHSFNEVVSAINSELGTDVQPEYEPVPIDNYVYDTEADTGDTPPGWEARVGFREGIRRVCEQYR